MNILSRVISLTDAIRLARSDGDRREWYKEWLHFCIIAPDVRVVVNFSLTGDNRPAGAPGVLMARVTLLVFEVGRPQEGVWDGDIDEIAPGDVDCAAGEVDMRFGHNRLVFKHGEFHISLALAKRPLTLDVRIRPATYPLLRSRAPIGPGAIDWLVVPRLEAYGDLVVDRRVHRLEAAPTYHDHNWGDWLWGQDFAWQWGFALPGVRHGQWSVVYECMTDRARTQVKQHKLCVWKGEKLSRIFAHQDIAISPQGYLPPQRIAKFPRVMALIAPEWTTDVPRCFEIEAMAGRDSVSCRFEAQEVAQIVIPNETDLGETIINEVVGRVRAEGRVKGEPVVVEGEGFFEFLS